MAELATFRISPLTSPPIQSCSHLNFAFNTYLAGKLSTNFSLSFHPKTPNLRISASRKLPARDRVIDFGKYKGRMIGSLPSNYLQWVSKNLRARDFEEWANRADEVLIDPIYRDRIEWEFAEKVLNGNGLAASSRASAAGDAVSELLEISERFGWDNNDKAAWSKIDFGLLGTSKGGRIPRAAAESCGAEIGSEEKDETAVGEDGGRRRERRERMKQRRGTKGNTSSDAVGTAARSGSREGKERREERRVVPVPSPFPGREALLKKALNRERLF